MNRREAGAAFAIGIEARKGRDPACRGSVRSTRARARRASPHPKKESVPSGRGALHSRPIGFGVHSALHLRRRTATKRPCTSARGGRPRTKSTDCSPAASWNGSTVRCSMSTPEPKAGALGSRPSDEMQAATDKHLVAYNRKHPHQGRCMSERTSLAGVPRGSTATPKDEQPSRTRGTKGRMSDRRPNGGRGAEFSGCSPSLYTRYQLR